MKAPSLFLIAAALIAPTHSEAGSAYGCGGMALAGGAQLLCSHVDPKAPSQSCNYSWALMTTENVTSVVQGTFLLPRGASNQVVFQGFGYEAPLASPIIVCEGSPG